MLRRLVCIVKGKDDLWSFRCGCCRMTSLMSGAVTDYPRGKLDRPSPLHCAQLALSLSACRQVMHAPSDTFMEQSESVVLPRGCCTGSFAYHSPKYSYKPMVGRYLCWGLLSVRAFAFTCDPFRARHHLLIVSKTGDSRPRRPRTAAPLDLLGTGVH